MENGVMMNGREGGSSFQDDDDEEMEEVEYKAAVDIKPDTKALAKTQTTTERAAVDSVFREMDVVVGQAEDWQNLYRVQFPSTKGGPFNQNGLKVRFKKNVKMLEMTMDMDVFSGSYDRGKAQMLASVASGGLGGSGRALDTETFQGRSYKCDASAQYAAGYIKDNSLCLLPVNGAVEMRRSIAYMNNQGKRQQQSDDADSDVGESDVEGTSESASPIRVRFTRTETARQKKRREESSLHRSKLIEQDPWVDLDVRPEQKVDALGFLEEPGEPNEGDSATGMEVENGGATEKVEDVDPNRLIQEAILGKTTADVDLKSSDQLISLRRIRNIPEEQQVCAIMIKARVITTRDAARYVSPSISTATLLERLCNCAHLVCGVWVIRSELLFRNDSQTVFCAARDLALALLNADLPVTRHDLQDAFGLSLSNLDTILSTFGVIGEAGPSSHEQSWCLKVAPDPTFGKTKEELQIMVEETRFWHKRWEDIHQYLQAERDRAAAAAGARRRRSSSRRSTSSASGGGGKRRTLSGTASVVID